MVPAGRQAARTPRNSGDLSHQWSRDGEGNQVRLLNMARAYRSQADGSKAAFFCSSATPADTMLRGIQCIQYLLGINKPALRPSVASLGRRCALGIFGSCTPTV